MFNIGASELILLLLIAFIVVGPKDLPKVARTLGRFVRTVRSMAAEVKREAGLDDLEKDFRDVRHQVQDTLREADVRGDLRKAEKEIDGELRSVREELNPVNQANHHAGGNEK